MPSLVRYAAALTATAYIPTLLALALQPDIRADTNRDGSVDINGDSDVAQKAIWTDARGAIFLPNIGDADERCYITDRKGNPLSSAELAACNDASGDVLLSPEYLAPLRTLPLSDVPKTAYAHIYATPDAAYKRVRLFARKGDDWRLVDRDYAFESKQLAEGLVLGIDGRELVTNSDVWNGTVTVRFDVLEEEGNVTASDAEALKLAPVLTHHHLQRVDTLITTAGDEEKLPAQSKFVTQLDKARKQAGLESPLLLFPSNEDMWTQDFMEPAYASMPGPHGPIAIRITLRSAQTSRRAGRLVFEQLRGKGIGGFQPSGRLGRRSIDSTGNFETIPPYTSKAGGGVTYKAGRIILGKHYDELPAQAMLDFLHGQRIQNPLLLETGWLFIGHVDEFVQFLPFNNTLGWTISVADTTSALALLRDTQAAGHGGVHASSFKPSGNTTDKIPELNITIDELLSNKTFLDANAYAQRHIDANMKVLLSELPVAAEDVIRVPSLFMDNPSDDGLTSRQDGMPAEMSRLIEGERQLLAFGPGAINGIVLNGHYLSPDPWGPVVDGQDIFKRPIEAAYSRAGMPVIYIDDFLSHHIISGEIHCGSNTFRQTDQQWWD